MVQVPCGTQRLYHSRAARDLNRDGAFPLQKGTKRQVITFRLLAMRGFRPLGLVSGPYGPPIALASVHPRCASRLSV